MSSIFNAKKVVRLLQGKGHPYYSVQSTWITRQTMGEARRSKIVGR